MVLVKSEIANLQAVSLDLQFQVLFSQRVVATHDAGVHCCQLFTQHPLFLLRLVVAIQHSADASLALLQLLFQRSCLFPVGSKKKVLLVDGALHVRAGVWLVGATGTGGGRAKSWQA